MSRFGVKERILLLTLLPSSLLAIVLGCYFIWNQLSDMQKQLDLQGQLIVEQLLPMSAQALSRHDQTILTRIANQQLNTPNVRSIRITDSQHQVLVHVGPEMLTPMPPALDDRLSMVSELDSSHFLLPVLGRHYNLLNDNEIEAGQILGWIELELTHNAMLLQGYRSMLTSFLLITGVLLLIGAFALRMGNAITHPLLVINQGVELLKEGKLQTRLPLIGSRELDSLSSGFNRMAEVLQNTQEEMQHSIDQAIEDARQNLEIIEVQNIELDLARKEALEASRIKSEFLANMSHEIRTPLNGILGFANLLRKTELNNRQKDYLETIHRSADTLQNIINGILDFSKIEAGKLALEHLPFNLRDLIQESLTLLAPTAHAKQLELVSLIYRDTPIHLQGDPQRIKQVLNNLISNAVKFTHNGSIVVRAMLEEEHPGQVRLKISVQDTGIGLSEENQQVLFRPFSQVDNSMSRQTGGTGLGLVISKHLVEQMGGKIGVNSSPDEGSEFWFTVTLPTVGDYDEDPIKPFEGIRIAMMETQTLSCHALEHQLNDFGLHPNTFSESEALLEFVKNERQPLDILILGLSEATYPEEKLARDIEKFEGHSNRILVICPTTEHENYRQALPEHIALTTKPITFYRLRYLLQELIPTLKGPSPYPQRTVKVLCVDDNEANLLLIKTLLTDLGAEVIAVNSGYAALEIIEHERFDLIFMDVQMPAMDGRKTTKAIRMWEMGKSYPAIPIIALTAHALLSEKRQLLQAGMDDYLTKPIDERQLSQVILKWTGLHLGLPLYQLRKTPKLERKKILDYEEGLSLAAGKSDLALDMMSMLVESLHKEYKTIRQARASQDKEMLLERIHALNGATRYCGVPQLRAACQTAETLLKRDAPSMNEALDDLERAIEAVFGVIGERPASQPATDPACEGLNADRQ